MAIDFKLPDLGENVESGDIVNVLVHEGDEVQSDQPVMEIETGKAVVELPCPHAGRVTKIHVKKGSKVKVGDPLLSLEGAEPRDKPKGAGKPAASETKKAPEKGAEKSDGKISATAEAALEPKEDLEQQVREEVQEKPAPARKKKSSAPAAAPSAKKSAAPRQKLPPAGPATRRLARELGVDLTRVNGSGQGGRITEEDIKAAVREGRGSAAAGPLAPAAPLPEGTAARDDWGPIRRQKMTAIRKAIAVNMARSHATAAQLTNFDDADITELERIRKGGLADYGQSNVKLTMMPFVIKAVAQSLRLHPMLNSSVDMENEEITYHEYVNIGVAVDTDRGLIVPVIREVDRMSIPRIAQELTTVAERVRSGHFKLEELRGSTFTISNLGSVSGTYSTPIINLPNVAILLLGRSRKVPVVVDDKIEPRLMMPLSLSYDHRAVDGATAARFLNEVIGYLHIPGRLLLAP